MKIVSSIAVLGLAAGAIAISQPAWGWGEEGHLTICEIAYRNLTPTANDAVDKLLDSKGDGIRFPAKKGPRDQTAARYYKVFNRGCLEEDTRPRAHSSQHFINVARDTDHISGDTCPPKEPGDTRLTNCILNGINEQLKILSDKSKSQRERVEALMGLGHWVGDIHQPLHVSFSDDNGGNDVLVKLVKGAKCGTSGYRPKNLHAVWDGCLLQDSLFERVRQSQPYIKAKAKGKPWGSKSVIYAAATELMAKTTVQEEKDWVKTKPYQWAEESYAKTLKENVGYCVDGDGGCRYSVSLLTLPAKPKSAKSNPLARTMEIDRTYLTDNEGYATERVRMAGHRLAHLINKALDPNYAGPEQNKP